MSSLDHDDRVADLVYIVLPRTDSQELNNFRFNAAIKFLDQMHDASVVYGRKRVKMTRSERYGDRGVQTIKDQWPPIAFSEREDAA